MDGVEIVDLDNAVEWRPWEPPLWLIGLGFTIALLVGFFVSGQVTDPRTAHPAAPTPCIPTAVQQQAGVNYVWTFCP
jgi:hypothetical protein